MVCFQSSESRVLLPCIGLLLCLAASVVAAPVPVRKGSQMPSHADVSREFMDREEAGRQSGLASGVTGEFIRYKYLFYKQPTEDDRLEALSAGRKLRCDVCAVILAGLLDQAKSYSEDDIADMLDGDTDFVPTGEQVTDRMLQHKKGCNKHFKDEVISKGYVVRQCKDVAAEKLGSDPCLHKQPKAPNEQAIETYEVWKESIFYACEQTVASHKDALASALSVVLRQGQNHTEAASSACFQEAQCSSERGKLSKAETGQKRRKRKRKQKQSREDL